MIQHVCSYGRSMKHLWLAVMFAMMLPFASQAHAAYSASELDTLVSTIALYPDPLLVHVLNASMYSDDIPSANAFAQAHKYEKGEDLAYAIEDARLDYDESVIALIPFPDVLRKMAKYRTWTAQLGYAVRYQRDDVFAAVQRLRVVAYDYGHLRSNEWVNVGTDGYVTIDPVKENYVYVPEYNPHYVFYAAADNVLRVRYATGILLGAWFFNWGWEPFAYDWRFHRPIYRYGRSNRLPPPRHYYNDYPHRFGHNPPPPSNRIGHNPPPPSNRIGHNPPPPSNRIGHNPPPPSNHIGHNPPPPSNHIGLNPPPHSDRGNPPMMRDDRNHRDDFGGRPGQDRYRNQPSQYQGNGNPPPSNPPSSRRPSYDDNGGSNHHFDAGRHGGSEGGRHGGDDRRGGSAPSHHSFGGRK